MTTIDALLRENLRTYPLNTALRWKEAGTWQELSYGDLAALVDHIAAGLLASGFAAGDRAALIGPSSPRWVASYFGILRAGGIVVPIDKELKSAELRHILGDSEVRVIFVDRDHLDSLLEMSGALSAVKRIVLLHDQPCSTTLDASEKELLRQVRDELSGFLEDLSLSAEQSARLRGVVATVASLAGTET